MLKIIIVEDEDIIRKGLVFTIDWLKMNSIVVAEASDGQEGLEKIIELKPDVVITDIKMPNLNGIEMIQKAQEYHDFKSLILTSYTEFEYAKKAIELKTTDYLVKPVDEEKLKKIMKELYDEIHNEKKTEILLESTKNQSNIMDIHYYLQLENSTNSYVAKSIKRIQENYSDKISVESISDELGISASYLSRKFKDLTNHTFLELLNGYRVQQAIRLLNMGQYRVYEISEMTGFSDYKHFCSVFKRYTMMSPTRFVKREKQ